MSRKARENIASILITFALCQVVALPFILLIVVLLIATGNATVTPRALGIMGLRLLGDIALTALVLYAGLRIMPGEPRRETPGTWPELGGQR